MRPESATAPLPAAILFDSIATAGFSHLYIQRPLPHDYTPLGLLSSYTGTHLFPETRLPSSPPSVPCSPSPPSSSPPLTPTSLLICAPIP